MKKTKYIYAAFIVIAIALFGITFLLWTNSYQIALRRANIPKKGADLLYAGMDDNKREYRVVVYQPSEGDAIIAYLSRNNIGFWRTAKTETRKSAETGMLTMGWIKNVGIKRFAVSDASVFEWETHVVCCGSNAIKQIQLPSNQLPDNVTVNIRQAGSNYTLHFIAFGEAELLNSLDVHALLKNAGCIE